MELALIATVLSGVCYSLMVVTDKLMVGDCYQGNPNQAWFVSSIVGSIFGFGLTIILFLFIVFFGVFDWIDLIQTIQTLFIWKGLLMILIGAIGIQILLHYFRCFAEEAHSAAVASWLAATPVFIYAGTLAFNFFWPVGGIIKTSTDFQWILGVLVATFGLIGFEWITDQPRGNLGRYRRELILMLLFNVIYVIALRQILSSVNDDRKFVEILGLMPYYWLGFLAGSRVMLSSRERAKLVSNWKSRLHLFIVPILFVEVIGMLVFWFEYLGLTELDPTYVSIIVGTNIYLVYILNHALSYLRKWMLARDLKVFRIYGVQFLIDNLPNQKNSFGQILLEIAMIFLTILGILLITRFI